MNEINKIRKAFHDGKSINEVAEQFNRLWATIKNAVNTPLEKLESRGHRSGKKCKVVTFEVKEAIEAYFEKEEMLSVKKKQRYTAVVIYKGSKRQLQDVVKRLREKRGQIKLLINLLKHLNSKLLKFWILEVTRNIYTDYLSHSSNISIFS